MLDNTVIDTLDSTINMAEQTRANIDASSTQVGYDGRDLLPGIVHRLHGLVEVRSALTRYRERTIQQLTENIFKDLGIE